MFFLFQNRIFGLFAIKNIGIDTKMKSLPVLQAELWPNAFFVAAILEKWRHYEIIAKYDKIFKEQVKSFIFQHLAKRKVYKNSTNPIHVGLIVRRTSWRPFWIMTSAVFNMPKYFVIGIFHINRDYRCFLKPKMSCFKGNKSYIDSFPTRRKQKNAIFEHFSTIFQQNNP